MASDKYSALLEISASRKSRRDFIDKEVTPDLIEKIEQVAMTAPYASGRKNWEMLIVNDKKQIADLAQTVKDYVKSVEVNLNPDFKNEFLNYAKSFTNFESAPLLIIPTYRISKGMELMFESIDEDTKQWDRDNFVKSISCVIMLVLLAAESLNLASCPMTGPLIAEREFNKVLKIKKGRSVAAVIAIGYTNEKNG